MLRQNWRERAAAVLGGGRCDGDGRATRPGFPLLGAARVVSAGDDQSTPSLPDGLRQITVPIEFELQWGDEHISREEGLALFDAFASTEKSLHVNSGKHKELPRFEADSAVRFFTRHLGSAVTSRA